MTNAFNNFLNFHPPTPYPNVHAMSMPCPHHVHAISKTYPHHVHAMSCHGHAMATPCPRHVHSMSTSCPPHLHAMSTPCHSLSTPCPRHFHAMSRHGHDMLCHVLAMFILSLSLLCTFIFVHCTTFCICLL